MFKKTFVVALLLALGGTLYAGPFFQRRQQNSPPPSSLSSTGLCAESPGPVAMEKEAHVPQPSFISSTTDITYSQPPPTALEQIEGTGSRLLTGVKVPDKITHSMDQAALTKLDTLISALQRKPEPVSISPPVTEETSQRLSRILMILEWFLYVGGGLFGFSKVGQFLQLVAPVVSGLQSALEARSRMQTPTAAAPSSTQASGS